MFKNYFKTTWRNLLKNKWYSLINIVGLATGMAIALLIGLWITDERSFDHYHLNHSRLAQVLATQTWNGKKETNPGISVPTANELRTRYPGNFAAVSLVWTWTHILSVNDKKISQTGMWAQPDLPNMLTLSMISGKRNSFSDPSSILISASVAKALFGNMDPLNKVILVDNKINMKVTGVYEDLPFNTTFYDIKFMLPWDNKGNFWNTQSSNWTNHGPNLFVQLRSHADFDNTTAKIKDITKSHYRETNEALLLHPMDRWHLYGEFKNGREAGGRIQFVWLFGTIGIFVLLLACINFMNLSTARSEKRAKEVGIRKAVGSLRTQLIWQFLIESIATVFLAFVLAMIMVQLSLPLFNELSNKQMSIPSTSPIFWVSVLVFAFITGLISGSYPAIYLSGFKPIKVLKGTFRAARFASLPRKILVVLQFTISITLIIGTIIVYRQVAFAKNRPAGYNREGLITVTMNTPEIYGHYNAMRNDLLATQGITDMAESNSSPTEVWADNSGFEWKGKDPNINPDFGTIAVTHDFGKTLGWQITEGRDFSRDFPADSESFILNESAVRICGLKNPVGQTMKWLGKDHVITGVVKNMVMESPYMPAYPTIFQMQYGWVHIIIIRLKPGLPVRDALAKIEPVFRKYDPGSPFQYKFVDEEYAKKFSDEQRTGNVAGIFAGLAILISCLGLFGLASFVAEQRTREIGIRKVLGASIFNLWLLLSNEFIRLVFISCLISSPVAWYFLSQWLQRYEYRTPVTWWIFAAAGSGALLITLITVSFQAIRAALMNPVKSLRTE